MLFQIPDVHWIINTAFSNPDIVISNLLCQTNRMFEVNFKIFKIAIVYANKIYIRAYMIKFSYIMQLKQHFQSYAFCSFRKIFYLSRRKTGRNQQDDVCTISLCL